MNLGKTSMGHMLKKSNKIEKKIMSAKIINIQVF